MQLVRIDCQGRPRRRSRSGIGSTRFRNDRRGYTDAKGPFLWELIRRADAWAQAERWASGPSDA